MEEKSIGQDTDTSSAARRNRRVSIALRIVFTAALTVFIVAAVHLASIYLSYKKADESYDDLRELYGVSDDTADARTDEDTAAAHDETEEAGDLSWLISMHESYPDICGWIRIEDTAVDYPLMHRGDDTSSEYYLHRDYSGSYSVNGSIFLDSQNSPYMDDAHTIIYGHNMNSGAMFADVKKYEDSAFYERRPEVIIWSVDADGHTVHEYRYSIFAANRTVTTSNVYTIGYQLETDYYRDFLDMLVSSSLYDTGITPDGSANIITLSTCTSSTGDGRNVVHAVLTSERSFS